MPRQPVPSEEERIKEAIELYERLKPMGEDLEDNDPTIYVED